MTTDAGDDTVPVWFPDGVYIFYSDASGITRMNADGTGKDQIIASGVTLDLSPDGTMIAYRRFFGGNFDIYTAAVDGSNLVQRTTDPGSDQDPAFSADGARIYFNSDRTGNSNIHSLTLADSTVTH